MQSAVVKTSSRMESQVEALRVCNGYLVSQVEVLKVEILQVFSVALVRREAGPSSSSARTLPAH